MKPKTLKIDRIDPTALLHNPRASNAAWIKYEPLILAAVAQHPKPYIFHPTNHTAATVESRLREAIRGKLAFDYNSTLSTPDLAHWYNQIVIKVDPSGGIYIGPPNKLPNPVEGSGSSEAKPRDMRFDTLSFEEVAAFTLLLSTGKLIGPVIITSPPDLSLLPPRPNVETLSREDGSIVLI